MRKTPDIILDTPRICTCVCTCIQANTHTHRHVSHRCQQEKGKESHLWWLMTVILAHRSLRQVYHCESKASVGYSMGPVSKQNPEQLPFCFEGVGEESLCSPRYPETFSILLPLPPQCQITMSHHAQFILLESFTHSLGIHARCFSHTNALNRHSQIYTIINLILQMRKTRQGVITTLSSAQGHKSSREKQRIQLKCDSTAWASNHALARFFWKLWNGKIKDSSWF